MRVDEEQRRALFDRVRDHLDEETATLLLEVTVPANIDLATRGDVQELRAEMLLRFAQLDGRIAAVEGRIEGLEGRIGGLEARIGGLEERIGGLEGKIGGLEERIGGLEGKLYRVVIPVLATLNLLFIGIATWIGTLVA